MGFCVCLCFAMHYFVFILVLQSLEEEKKAGCFAFVVLQMYNYYKFSVALPHGSLGWSVVCDCGISYSYSLRFLIYVYIKRIFYCPASQE